MKVINNYSNSGRTNQSIVVIPERPSIKSRASYELLKNKLISLDDEYFLNDCGELHKWLKFREEYLLEQKKIKGNLVCKYCGKKHLEIGGRSAEDLIKNNKNKNLATIDHVYPLSKGGKKYDWKNMVVSCKRCNRNKGDKIL
jgi:hypothetical protein